MGNILELIEQVKDLTMKIEPLVKADKEDTEDKPVEKPEETPVAPENMEDKPVVDSPAAEPSEPPPAEPSPDISQDVNPDTEEESEPEYEEIISVMSPEELDKLEQAIVKVKAGRSKPAEEVPPPAAPEQSEQMEKMMKSMQAQMDTIEGLKKQVAQLTTKLSEKPMNISKPAAMNKKDVQVLEKSEQPPEMLSKSEVIDHLRGEQKKGNRLVDTGLIFDATSAATPDQLRRVYAEAEKRGLKLPMKVK